MKYTKSGSGVSLSLNVPFRYYLFALLSAVLSSCQIPFFPELQLVCIFLLIALRVDALAVVLCLIVILCTSVYAIPDPVLRASPQDYPSIYTKGYSYVRLLDVLAVIIFLYAFPAIRGAIIHKRLLLLYGVLVISLFSLLLNHFFGVSNYSYLFFGVRNLLIAVSFALMLKRIAPESISSILVFAMVCWIFKMIFMILLPSDNVIEREIFGIPWKIFLLEMSTFHLCSSVLFCYT